jgi:nitrite reductase (NADH) small subunit
MREINVGPESAFADPGRKLIESEGLEVGIFQLGGEFFAYENVCPHIGGPACQGKIIAKVEEDVAADRTSQGFVFSKTKINVVCPWHGFEFDIRTGRHHGNPRYRLKPIKVRVDDGQVIVSLPEEKKPQNTTVQPTPDGNASRPVF